MDLNKHRLIKQCQISLGEEFDHDFLYFEEADFTSIKSIRATYELFEKNLDGRTRAFKEKLKKLSYAKGSLGEDDIEEKSEKELDAKSLKDLIKNPSPKMVKQYGGKDKYIKMLKSKLAKLESSEIEEAKNITVRALRQMMFKIDSSAADKFRKELFKVDAQDSPASAAQIKQGKKIVGNKFGRKDFQEAKIPSSNIAKFSNPKAAKQAASKQKYKTQIFMGDDDKFWVPSTNKEAGQLKKAGYEVYESTDLEEAIKFWTVTITKKAGKLFKGQTVDVKARNSVEAINKGLKQMKVNPKTFPSDSVDAVLGESVEESTELFQKGKITFTKFAMGKGKGSGLQINYGRQYIQVPEKDIKQLYTALVYVTKSVPQFKI